MHLAQFITDSIESGLQVILTMDTNEHMVTGKLDRQLQKLGLVEAYSDKFKSLGPASCFRGRHQVDGVWCTRGIVPTSVSTCPFNFGAGDHIVYEVDFQVKIIVGDLALPLFSPNKRCLMSSFLIIVQRYPERSEAQFTLYKIPFRFHKLKE